MNFGNNDYWLRFDSKVDRVEAVRGALGLDLRQPGAGRGHQLPAAADLRRSYRLDLFDLQPPVPMADQRRPSAHRADENFRYSDIHDNFTTQFLNVTPLSSVIGSTVNGGLVASARYAAGPFFTGPYVNNNPNINVLMRDMGSVANNLSLAAKTGGLGGTLTATAGWFYTSQNISQEWHVNPQISTLEGRNKVPPDLFTAAGRQLSVAGQTGFNNNGGSCCARDVNLTYVDNAPILSLNYSGHGPDLDGSVRFDRVTDVGTAIGGVTGPNITVSDALGSAALPSLIAAATPENINYEKNYTSWSLGALYEVARTPACSRAPAAAAASTRTGTCLAATSTRTAR
jgi:hypothetical protein